MSEPRLTRSAEGTAYLALTADAPAGSVRQREVSLSDEDPGETDLLLDINAEGRVIGIEFLTEDHLPRLG